MFITGSEVQQFSPPISQISYFIFLTSVTPRLFDISAPIEEAWTTTRFLSSSASPGSKTKKLNNNICFFYLRNFPASLRMAATCLTLETNAALGLLMLWRKSHAIMGTRGAQMFTKLSIANQAPKPGPLRCNAGNSETKSTCMAWI